MTEMYNFLLSYTLSSLYMYLTEPTVERGNDSYCLLDLQASAPSHSTTNPSTLPIHSNRTHTSHAQLLMLSIRRYFRGIRSYQTCIKNKDTRQNE